MRQDSTRDWVSWYPAKVGMRGATAEGPARRSASLFSTMRSARLKLRLSSRFLFVAASASMAAAAFLR